MGHVGISWMFVRWRKRKWGNGQTVHRLSETTLTTEEMFALEARGGVYTVTKGLVKDENYFAQNCCPSTAVCEFGSLVTGPATVPECQFTRTRNLWAVSS